MTKQNNLDEFDEYSDRFKNQEGKQHGLDKNKNLESLCSAVQIQIFARYINSEGLDEKDDEDDEDQENKDHLRYKMYVETFKVSPTTTMKALLKAASDYWGIVDTSFSLFKP